jgi:hypothetical protein
MTRNGDVVTCHDAPAVCVSCARTYTYERDTSSVSRRVTASPRTLQRAMLRRPFSTSGQDDGRFCTDSGNFYAGHADHGLHGRRGRIKTLIACQPRDRRAPWRLYFNTVIVEANNG